MDNTITTNGRSIAFVKNRIASGQCFGGTENNIYDSMCEFGFEQFVKNNLDDKNKEIIKFLNNEAVLTTYWRDDNEEKISVKVELKYQPDCEFECYIRLRCLSDGIAYYYTPQLMYEIIERIIQLRVGDKTKEILNGSKVIYRIGDFVLASEHDSDFMDDKRLWRAKYMTVFLPIAMEVV